MAPPWYLLLLVALVGALEEEGATRALPMITDVACTKQMGCPEEYSCVRTPLSGSACCPLDQGTPCQDGHHCCPSGTHCSEDGHSCLPASNQSAIICPDGSSECPSGATCCQMPDQSWGCCPLEQATCCSDHVHCCPQNTLCDLVHGTCVSGEKVVPMSKKLPARMKLQPSGANVPCDPTTSCPGETTCCRLSSGEWGCCPFVQAVCCSDHVHCCPNGYTCSDSGCEQDQVSIPWMKKIPALKQESTRVYCDSMHYCPDQSTCCRLASGAWACCPYKQAVCCADHIHCCPPGYSCARGSCMRQQISVPWLEKMPALKEKSTDIPCDESHFCPDQSTCCRLPSGEWGCCPIVQAICCSDQSHCCPSGWRCGEHATCSIGQLSFPWLSKTLTSAQVKCDKSHSCPQGTTCCHTEGGGWACCPLEEAVCCSDHLHCCPSGYTCDVSTGSCNKPVDEPAIPEPASPVAPLDYVYCDRTHVCYDGQTCCARGGGSWSCCPYTQGVCCPDTIHCCPYGHICLNQGAYCSRSDEPRWDLGWMKKKQPAL